jgi:hypothetical protein
VLIDVVTINPPGPVNFDVGLYGDIGAQPGPLLAETGVVALTAAGPLRVPFDFTFEAGTIYWLAGVVFSIASGSFSLRVGESSFDPAVSPAMTNQPGSGLTPQGFRVDGVTASPLPDPLVLGPVVTTSPPRYAFQVA